MIEGQTLDQTKSPQDAVPAGAVKYDAGKPQVFKGAIAYFPKAITGVATVSGFGAAKYAWGGWRHVDDGIARYTDGMVRHLTAEATGEVLDPESGFPHAWHVAWGALARAELMAEQGLIPIAQKSNT